MLCACCLPVDMLWVWSLHIIPDRLPGNTTDAHKMSM